MAVHERGVLMKRMIVALGLLAACGCATPPYPKGVNRTVCEVWINSMPQGALLYLNGHYVGRTPYKYTAFNDGDSSAHFIVRDLAEIIARKRGFDDETETITIENCYKKLWLKSEGVQEQVKHYRGGITLYMDVREGFSEKEYGNVSITAVPEDAGAEIYLNDSLIGNGKTSLLKLPAGSYILKIRKSGYKTYARVISVLAENDLTITAPLQKAEGVEEEAVPVTETGSVEQSPAGREAEMDEDYTPGTVGGTE